MGKDVRGRFGFRHRDNVSHQYRILTSICALDMTCCMRTTINLPDDLMTQIKKLAAASHSTVTALIEDTLRESLAGRRRSRRPGRATLPTYGKKGLLHGVDLDDTASLFDAMVSSGDSARR